ncbi:MAG: zf-HC2 domain-containing protein [Ardenticatenaceae bacterium]|nr:zf-HC2 domain-containing protein [Ardenticatenaceae bacterium]
MWGFLEMTCNEISELMALALDQPLDERARSGLRAHLQGCGNCRRLWSAFQEVDRLFRASPLATAPPGFTARTVAVTLARKRRDSMILGGIALLWAMFVVVGLLLMSILDSSGIIIGLLGQPTVLTQAPQWVGLLGEVLLNLGQMAWSLVWLLRQIASLPAVALTLLLAMSSGLVVLIVLMRTGQQPAPSLL